MMFNIHFSAALNVFALSESTCNGTPLLDVNLLKQWRNAVTFISVTRSICIARVTQQVNRRIQMFLESKDSVCLVYSGPTKSTPVYEKGGLFSTQMGGNGGGDEEFHLCCNTGIG